MYIKADTYDYFVSKCKNKICDEVCPTVINMLATSSVVPSAGALSSQEHAIKSIPGRFPEASQRLLTPGELSKLSKADLEIMRNEIFARHGYKFTTATMKEYFSRQTWYTPTDSNVSSQLTAVERSNVELIKKFE